MALWSYYSGDRRPDLDGNSMVSRVGSATDAGRRMAHTVALKGQQTTGNRDYIAGTGAFHGRNAVVGSAHRHGVSVERLRQLARFGSRGEDLAVAQRLD